MHFILMIRHNLCPYNKLIRTQIKRNQSPVQQPGYWNGGSSELHVFVPDTWGGVALYPSRNIFVQSPHQHEPLCLMETIYHILNSQIRPEIHRDPYDMQPQCFPWNFRDRMHKFVDPNNRHHFLRIIPIEFRTEFHWLDLLPYSIR